MKVCLINPPRLMKPMSAVLKPAPPLGLAFIAAALRARGDEVTVIDTLAEGFETYHAFKDALVANGLSPSQIAERIVPDTRLIGLSVMFSANWPLNRALIDYLGAQFPGAIIVAGGEHITAAAEFSLRQTRRLDVCVLGEGEATVVELAEAIEQGRDLATVDGIVYRGADGAPVRNERRRRITELDDIARPAWDLFPLKLYREKSMIYGVDRGVTSLPVLATRGCPYQCTFCSSPAMWGTRYLMRTPQAVADEIEYFATNYGVGNFDFYDLTAIIRKTWIIDFCRELISRKLDITWQIPAGTRSEAIDQEVAQYLHRSGCRNITYAPEAGAPETLRAIKKKVNLQRMLRSIRYSARERMNIKINFMLGFPNETHRNIWQSIAFLVRASWYGAHDMSPSIFSPYPGSALFEQLRAAGRIDMEDDEYFYRMIYVDTLLSNHFYNDHVSGRALRAYVIVYLVVFYGTNYLFHPSRILATIYHLLTNRLESRAEMGLVDLITRSKIKVLPAAPGMDAAVR
jgi:radical SAM superfamily enzyme YgiQ (UPF0313 family)